MTMQIETRNPPWLPEEDVELRPGYAKPAPPRDFVAEWRAWQDGYARGYELGCKGNAPDAAPPEDLTELQAASWRIGHQGGHEMGRRHRGPVSPAQRELDAFQAMHWDGAPLAGNAAMDD